MTEAATLQIENNRLMLSGDLNFGSVVTLWHESLPLLQIQEKIIIDLSRVKSTNSSGLALMIEWLKWAKQHHREISFIAVPKELLSIAKVCGLEALLR